VTTRGGDEFSGTRSGNEIRGHWRMSRARKGVEDFDETLVRKK
jgi:hypothetical protein